MSWKAVVGGQLIDGTGAEPIEHGAILIEGQRIAAVGAAGEVDIPDEAEVIDANGKTVMPGVIDGHQHCGFGLASVARLRANLSRGATTVVGAASGPDGVKLRNAIEAGQVGAASRYRVGAVVGATGGHLHREDEHISGVDCDGPWEIRKGVRQMSMLGVDFIKTAASGGFQWANESTATEDYTVEELRALCEEAHARHKQVIVHAHTRPGIDHAIECGCDQIHHCALIDEEGVYMLRDSGRWFVPTLHVTSEWMYGRDWIPAYMRERMAAAEPVHRKGVRLAHEIGVPIAVGTDGSPGDAMHEMMELVGCGMTPMEAIVAGTHNAAKANGVLEDYGTLEVGKRADLLVINGDPLQDIALLYPAENIQLVMKDGVTCVTDDEFNKYMHPREHY